MIKKDLKVGDTFIDGNITYKVLEVNSDGTYISTSNLTDEDDNSTDKSQPDKLKEANAKAKKLEKENQQIKDSMKEALDKIATLESALIKSREIPATNSAEDTELTQDEDSDSSQSEADIIIVPNAEK